MTGIKTDWAQEDAPTIKKLRTTMTFVRKFALYGLSDDLPRAKTFAAKLKRMERATAAHPDDLRAMLNAAGIDDLTERQIRRGLEILASDGEEAFRRYVAKEVATFVHYSYARELRSRLEQTDIGVILGNLLTFGRSTAQRLGLAIRKVQTGKTTAAKWRGVKTIISMWVGMYVGDKVLEFLFGRRAYRPSQVFGWVPGGLMLGLLQDLGEVAYQVMRAMEGQRGALDRAVVGIMDLKDSAIPWSGEILNILEAATGTKGLDMHAYRKIKAAVKDNYTPQSPKVQRTTIEAFQMGFSGAPAQPLRDVATLDALNWARIRGIDVRKVRGTLSDGRVGLSDVKAYAKATR